MVGLAQRFSKDDSPLSEVSGRLRCTAAKGGDRQPNLAALAPRGDRSIAALKKTGGPEALATGELEARIVEAPERALLPLLAVARLVAALAEHAALAVGLADDWIPAALETGPRAGITVLAEPRGCLRRQTGLGRGSIVKPRLDTDALGSNNHLNSL